MILDGQPWFVAVDACRILDIGMRSDGSFNTTQGLRKLDADEKGVHPVHSLGGWQRTSVVSEPGLYKLIQRSNKPAAKRFDRWVRHEVLPAIRKNGAYVMKGADVA